MKPKSVSDATPVPLQITTLMPTALCRCVLGGCHDPLRGPGSRDSYCTSFDVQEGDKRSIRTSGLGTYRACPLPRPPDSYGVDLLRMNGVREALAYEPSHDRLLCLPWIHPGWEVGAATRSTSRLPQQWPWVITRVVTHRSPRTPTSGQASYAWLAWAATMRQP